MHSSIALVGLSGSGKTTAGPLLAAALGWRYVDTDDLVVARAGRSIADLFETEGEAAFRALETDALHTALAMPNTVIATGGGIVEASDNRERLRSDAFTVWLHAPPATLQKRLIEQTDRPLLRENPIGALQQMLDRRAALYADVARWTIATDALTPAQVADEIVRAWRMQERQMVGSGVRVTTPGGSYAVEAGAGLLQQVADQWAAVARQRRERDAPAR
jgi:shikimate kinase